MSFSRSGPEPVANSLGKIEFGKWHLYQTSIKEDVWRKPVLNVDGYPESDSYIQIKRLPVNLAEREFKYEILLHGRPHLLLDSLKGLLSEHKETKDIQVVKDYIDRCIEKVNKLLAFI